MFVQEFKLAVLALDDFSDAEVENLFLNLEVVSEDDIIEVVGIMECHRSALLKKITQKFCKGAA